MLSAHDVIGLMLKSKLYVVVLTFKDKFKLSIIFIYFYMFKGF